VEKAAKGFSMEHGGSNEQRASDSSGGRWVDDPIPSSPLSPADLKTIRATVTGEDPELRRFSMWELLAIVTGASLVLAVGTYVPKPVFAGAVGMATLISMVALSAMKHPSAALQIGWWILLLIYLMAIGSAVWN
jgi:hypothetical protein